MMTEQRRDVLQLKIRSGRRSVPNIQVMGLFGLGGFEIAVICVGIGVVLGPQKIGDLLRSTGQTASEFKNELDKVPDEFQKGYEEGQIESRSRKAKPMVAPDTQQKVDAKSDGL
jgi:Sec-independent protein translocase protein TatA